MGVGEEVDEGVGVGEDVLVDNQEGMLIHDGGSVSIRSSGCVCLFLPVAANSPYPTG